MSSNKCPLPSFTILCKNYSVLFIILLSKIQYKDFFKLLVHRHCNIRHKASPIYVTVCLKTTISPLSKKMKKSSNVFETSPLGTNREYDC